MEQIKLDIVPVGVAPVAHASQFDNGRQIRFNLFNQGTPYTLTGAETVTMVVNGEEENITNTSDNYVIWDVADEDCEETGVIGCELRIVLGDMLIGSKNFFLEVEMDPYNGKGLRVVTVGPADICTFEPTISEPLVNVKCELTPSLDGYSAVNLTACGVNLWDEEWELGIINTLTGENEANNNCIRSKNYIPCSPSTQFYFKTPSNGYVFFYDDEKNYISYTTGAFSNAVFTSPANAKFMRFRLVTGYGTTYNNDISINYPANDTQYHPYTGNAYAIALGDTYYGGTLDVTTGVLTVTHLRADLGDLNWINYGNTQDYDRYISTSLDSLAKQYGFIICTTLSNVPNTVDSIWLGGGTGRLSATSQVGAYTNATAFKNAMSGVYITYELATPIVIDLGSGTVVTARSGEVNNVFADCGQTELKYLTIEV